MRDILRLFEILNFLCTEVKFISKTGLALTPPLYRSTSSTLSVLKILDTAFFNRRYLPSYCGYT